MGSSQDGLEFDLAVDHVEERSTPRPPAGPPALSLPPVSGDSEDLEFDLSGATSRPAPPIPEPRSFSSFHPDAILPPAVSSEIVSLERVGGEFHPPSLRVPDLGQTAGSGVARSVGSPEAAKPIVHAQFSVPDLAVPTRRSPTPSRASLPAKQSASLSAGASKASVRPPAGQPTFDMNQFGGNMLGDFELDEVVGMPPQSLSLGAGGPSGSDDGPWPTGVTPDRDALDISREKMEAMSGFPAAPGVAVLDALYFLSVRAAVKQLGPRQAAAEEKLSRLEQHRDDKLGEVGESFRVRLAKEQRFAALYAELAAAERTVATHKAELGGADSTLGKEFAELDVRLGEAGDKLSAQAQVLADCQKVSQTLERNLGRAKGLTSRLQIEMRNVARLAQERAPGAPHMPPELGERYTELEHEFARASTDSANLEREARAAKARQSDAHDQVRRLEADRGRLQAEREALLLKHETRSSGLVEALQKAESEVRLRRAETGRALLRLRTEVPVERGVRQSLFEREEAVRLAAFEAEALKRAAGAYDAGAFRRGRTVLLGFVGIIVVVLGWAVLR